MKFSAKLHKTFKKIFAYYFTAYYICKSIISLGVKFEFNFNFSDKLEVRRAFLDLHSFLYM